MSVPTICGKVGCIEAQPCAQHPKPAPFAGASRSSDLYGSARWKRERAAFLKVNPRCVWMYLGADLALAGAIPSVDAELCREVATVVDHHPAHRGDPEAFWNRSTWRALCRRHSNINTGRETHEKGRRA